MQSTHCTAAPPPSALVQLQPSEVLATRPLVAFHALPAGPLVPPPLVASRTCAAPAPPKCPPAAPPSSTDESKLRRNAPMTSENQWFNQSSMLWRIQVANITQITWSRRKVNK